MTDDRYIHRDEDGIDRRGFLKCMAWAGTGMIWTMVGGVLRSDALGRAGSEHGKGEFSFVQISDSHIGFSKEANKDVIGTLQAAMAKIDTLSPTPAFLIHTGDISHLSKPAEFDTVDQILKSSKVTQAYYVPGEHDVMVDNGKPYLERYGKGATGGGWYSFSHRGVHFVGLVNVLDFKAGLGLLGSEQLEWLEKDLKPLSSSTPIVLFAHIPLWSVYPQWGWGTDDAAQALSYLRRFGSVTVLNGHIHQTMQKIEGNITFHTAASTAFPKAKPVAGNSPDPMVVEASRLRNLLGVTSIQYKRSRGPLAIVDMPLEGTVASTSSQASIATGSE